MKFQHDRIRLCFFGSQAHPSKSALRYGCSSGYLALTSSFFLILLITVPVVESTEFTNFSMGRRVAAGTEGGALSKNLLRSCTMFVGIPRDSFNGRLVDGGGVNSSISSPSSEPSTSSAGSLARPFPLFDAVEPYSVGCISKGCLRGCRFIGSGDDDLAARGTRSPRSSELVPRSIISASFGAGFLRLWVARRGSITWMSGSETLL